MIYQNGVGGVSDMFGALVVAGIKVERFFDNRKDWF